MRWLAGSLLACWAAVAPAQTLDIRIHDSFGASYASSSIGDDLGALYNIGFDPVMVIVLASDPADDRLQEQRRILRGFDPDETGILYALGIPEGVTTRGYSVSGNTAAELLPGPDSFRVLVLNARGEIRLDSSAVVAAEDLLAVAPAQ